MLINAFDQKNNYYQKPDFRDLPAKIDKRR